MDELFFKVFRNKFIRYQISLQLEIFKNNQVIIYYSNTQIRNDKFIDYRDTIIINFPDILEEGILLLSSARNVIFCDGYNQVIPERTLPEINIEKIIFGRCYNQDIGVGVLPFGVKILHLGVQFDKELVEESIPSSITKLTLSNHYDKPLYALYPSSIKNLNLGIRFNNDLYCGSIPFGCENLKISSCFNKQLKQSYTFKGEFKEGSIPSTVKILNLGNFYNHELLPGLIPNSVTVLELSRNFNKILKEGSIPNSVTTLSFKSYNQEINENLFSNSIKHLDLGFNFNRELKNLPNQLESLILGEKFDQKIDDNSLPSSLKRLVFKNSKFNQLLPSSLLNQLESLKFLGGSSFNQPLAFNLSISKLHTLKFGENYQQIIQHNSIPSSVTRLLLPSLHSKLIPSSVTKLSFTSNFNSPIPVGSIPPSVKIIKFNSLYNQPILPHALSSAHTIYFSQNFSQSLFLNSIPSTCTNLSFDSFTFGGNTPPGIIPNSVTELSIPNLRSLVLGSIPSSVQKLNLFISPYPDEIPLIPSSVKYLNINSPFDRVFSKDRLSLPDTVECITVIQNSFSLYYEPDFKIPKSLKKLIISSYDSNIDNFRIV